MECKEDLPLSEISIVRLNHKTVTHDSVSATLASVTPVTPPVNLDGACARIRGDVIGRNDPLDTPFGVKPLVCKTSR